MVNELPPSKEPVLSDYIARWATVNVVAHEQERSAREDHATAWKAWARGEIERLERENQALRNLAENLRPGPISEALTGKMDEEYRRAGIEPRPDAVEALRPFVELYEKVDERYRKRGGTPDQFKDTHPFADIPAGDLPIGVWRRAQVAFRASQPPLPAPTKKPAECGHESLTFQCNDCGLDLRNAKLAKPLGDSVAIPMLRNALGNLYMAELRFGAIDADIRAAMGDAAKLLGSPYSTATKGADAP